MSQEQSYDTLYTDFLESVNQENIINAKNSILALQKAMNLVVKLQMTNGGTKEKCAYTTIHNALYEVLALTKKLEPMEYKLAMNLVLMTLKYSHVDKYITNDELADAISIDVRRLNRLLNKLVALNIVRRFEARLYRLNPVQAWKIESELIELYNEKTKDKFDMLVEWNNLVPFDFSCKVFLTQKKWNIAAFKRLQQREIEQKKEELEECEVKQEKESTKNIFNSLKELY